MLARELGGRVSGITLACTGMLGSLFFLAVGNFYSPNVYEPLFWTGAIYLLCRIINGAPSRTWIWLGAVAGLGIQNKHSMVFFGVAIALAILLTPERRQFGQKWIWLTGLIAFVIALPNIIWQIERSWPTWVLLHGIAQSHKNVVLTPWEFFSQQIALMNPVTFPLWFGGLIWLLASREGRALSRHRFHLPNRTSRIRSSCTGRIITSLQLIRCCLPRVALPSKNFRASLPLA